MPPKYNVGDAVQVLTIAGNYSNETYEVLRVHNNSRSDMCIYDLYGKTLGGHFPSVPEVRIRRYLPCTDEERSDYLLDTYYDYMALHKAFGDDEYLEEAERYKTDWLNIHREVNE